MRKYILTEIISVKFSNKGRAYFFDPSGNTISTGEHVIVETAKGLEYGICVRGNHFVGDARIIKPLRPIVRIATEHDKNSVHAGKEREKEAFDYCQKKIVELGLDMKLVNVEYGFEGNKILFFFTSEGRVDFRELVKDLASEFRIRIELRQIGVRDEAKMLGGFGVCGKVFCCSQFLTDFHPVSIKMAKTQGLSINPAKISGTCGRLMCCLKYEEAAYEDLVKKAPKVNSFVETPSGKGSVINVNLLRGNAKVRLEEGLDTTLKTFTFDELDVLGGKGRRQEYIAAKAEGRLEEAGFTASPPPPIKRTLEPQLSKPIREKKEPPPKSRTVTHDSTKEAPPKKKYFHKRRKGKK
jgi:cell fate regulator YaaT (PSP1 superfamily)